MRYVRPQYYDEFQCIADQCPDTCCAGWQIVIDDDSLDTYSKVKGPFGNRLYESIDWKEGIFRQENKRCSFLNEKNLCDLYSEMGPEALCQTCTRYPRHVEEFEGLRELSLSLSCPVAARLILTCREPLQLIEELTEEAEELEEEFEDFDLLLFSQLEQAREVIFQILQNRKWNLEQRINLALLMAEQMQKCVDEARYCDIDSVIGAFMKNTEQEGKETTFTKESRYALMCKEYTVLNRLERLRDEWSKELSAAWEVLYDHGEAHYNELCDKFDTEWGSASPNAECWSLFLENLMKFFVLTYFCGAVYDDWIYSKVALAAFSVRWIQEIIISKWAVHDIDLESCIKTAYCYAREIEHSDENLNYLEEWLQGDRSKTE